MRRPGIWWIGLASVWVLWLAAVQFEIGAFERGLSARANAVLAERLGAGASAEARGRDIAIGGTIFEAAARDEAIAAVAELPGVRRVADALSPPPPLAPYVWRAVWSGSTLTLSGGTPSPAARARLLATARQNFPGARIVDSMDYASGAPAGDGPRAGAALRALAKLQRGEAQGRDGRWSIAGEAATDADREAAQSLASALGDGAASAVVESPPPASAAKPEAAAPFTLGFEKAEKSLVLSGSCGDEASCARIRAAADERFAGFERQDSMRSAPGAPKDFIAAALIGLDRLAGLHSGRFGLRGDSAELRGEADSAAEAEAVKTGFLAGMPEGFSLKSDITGAEREAPHATRKTRESDASGPPAQSRAEHGEDPHVDDRRLEAKRVEAPTQAQPGAGECQIHVAQVAHAAVVAFDYASAELSPEASAALSRLAAEAVKCPQAALEISGHSDDVGSIAHNFDWSWRRAEAVAAFLLAAGMPPGRLRIEGLGETAPRAPNDSDENRAKNRRIEIRVR